MKTITISKTLKVYKNRIVLIPETSLQLMNRLRRNKTIKDYYNGN